VERLFLNLIYNYFTQFYFHPLRRRYGTILSAAPSAALLPAGPARTSTWAIISLVGGILGWLGLFGLGGLVAIICGHVGKGEIKNGGGTVTGGGMATAGLILGYLNVAFTILAVILAFVLPLMGIALCGGAGILSDFNSY
jgi:hypothetical protein